MLRKLFDSPLINPKSGVFEICIFQLIANCLLNPSTKTIIALKSALGLTISVDEITHDIIHNPNSPLLRFLNEILFCFLKFAACREEAIRKKLSEFHQEIAELDAEQFIETKIRYARIKKIIQSINWSQLTSRLGEIKKQFFSCQQQIMIQKVKELYFWWHVTKGDPILFERITKSVNWEYKILEENEKKN